MGDGGDADGEGSLGDSGKGRPPWKRTEGGRREATLWGIRGRRQGVGPKTKEKKKKRRKRNRPATIQTYRQGVSEGTALALRKSMIPEDTTTEVKEIFGRREKTMKASSEYLKKAGEEGLELF